MPHQLSDAGKRPKMCRTTRATPRAPVGWPPRTAGDVPVARIRRLFSFFGRPVPIPPSAPRDTMAPPRKLQLNERKTSQNQKHWFSNPVAGQQWPGPSHRCSNKGQAVALQDSAASAVGGANISERGGCVPMSVESRRFPTSGRLRGGCRDAGGACRQRKGPRTGLVHVFGRGECRRDR